MGESMSPADMSAVLGNHNNGGFGNDGGWAWLIIILALLGGFNGNGHKNQDGKEVFGYEDLCELVALSNNFINKVVDLYQKKR